MWDESEELLGGSIDIFCNNAGVPWQVNLLTRLDHALNHGTQYQCNKGPIGLQRQEHLEI